MRTFLSSVLVWITRESVPFLQCSGKREREREREREGGMESPSMENYSMVSTPSPTHKNLGEKKKKKKEGSLPLSMFILLDGPNVLPECPNASNPYHQCAAYCFDKISQANKEVGGEASAGRKAKMEVRKAAQPTCKNASVPYFKCASCCFRVVTEGDQAVFRKEHKQHWKIIEREDVNPQCKNASNPYHKCAEYCLQNTFQRDRAEESKSAVFEKGQKEAVKITEKGDGSPKCKYASNPFHKCAEYCTQKTPERDLAEESKSEESREKVELRKDVQPKSIIIATPLHKYAEYCCKEIMGVDQAKGGESGDGRLASKTNAKGNVSPICKYSTNPYHNCAEYCFQNTCESDQAEGGELGKSGEKMALGKDVYPKSINIFNPLHKRISKGNQAEKRKSVESKLVLKIPEKENVNIKCKYASNPYHNCAEYCLQNTPTVGQAEGSKSGVIIAPRKQIEEESSHPKCFSPASPNQNCAESYARKGQTNIEQSIQGLEMAEKRPVNPESIYAPNPYHTSADYCFEETREEKDPGSKSMVKTMGRKIARKVQTKSGDASDLCLTWAECFLLKNFRKDQDKGENKMKFMKIERWNVHPDCKYASNPFHVCVNECFDLIHEKDIVKRGVEKNKKGKKMQEDMKVQPKSGNAAYQHSVEYCSPRNIQKDEDEEGESDGGADCMPSREKRCESINATKPCHTCVEHWFQEFSQDKHDKEDSCSCSSSLILFLLGFIFILVYIVVTRVVSADKVLKTRENWNVHDKCIDPSDPNHRCAQSCYEEMDKSTVED